MESRRQGYSQDDCPPELAQGIDLCLGHLFPVMLACKVYPSRHPGFLISLGIKSCTPSCLLWALPLFGGDRRASALGWRGGSFNNTVPVALTSHTQAESLHFIFTRNYQEIKAPCKTREFRDNSSGCMENNKRGLRRLQISICSRARPYPAAAPGWESPGCPTPEQSRDRAVLRSSCGSG